MWERIGQFDGERGSWAAWLTAPSQEPGPEETVLQRERRAVLQRALEELPAGSRALLYRKYYYRQSTAQVAAELGLTERAVEGKLYRLKKRLRKSLGGEGHAGT